MGYRHYFEIVPKNEVETIRDLGKRDLVKYIKSQGRSPQNEFERGYIDFDSIFSELECVFEFGKLYWCDTASQIQKTGEPLFRNKSLKKYFDDYEPHLVNKNSIIKAIELQQKKVIDNYKECLKSPEECENEFDKRTIEQKCIESVESQLRWCQNGIVADASKENRKYELADTWLYEHTIFNLAYILRIIDFDKYALIFRGW